MTVCVDGCAPAKRHGITRVAAHSAASKNCVNAHGYKAKSAGRATYCMCSARVHIVATQSKEELVVSVRVFGLDGGIHTVLD